MEKKIKKILVGFFIIMVVLTMVSRAAASILVAKVQVDHVKKNNLTYTLTGSGEVKGNSKKYIELKAGYKVGSVKAKAGTNVKKERFYFNTM